MRLAGFVCGIIIALGLSAPVYGQTTQTVNLTVGGGPSSFSFGPDTPPCNYTGTATGYDSSIVSVTVTTGTNTISFTLRGLSVGMTTVTLSVTGQTSTCNYSEMLNVTVSASSGSTGIPINIITEGGSFAPQFYDISYPAGCVLSASSSNPNAGVATISPTVYQNVTSGDLSFTINGVSPGTDNITLTITVTGCSSAGTSNIVLNVTVQGPPGPLSIPGGGGASKLVLPGGTVSKAYNQMLTASGGTPPYSWSVLGGALPAGLSLSSSGVVSGVPSQAGGATFTAQVRDSSGSVSSIFVLTIAPAPLSLTTATPLPSGIVNFPYPAQVLTAAGGTPPYTFQASGLPAGLSLTNGVISGIPTTAGSPVVSLQVTDSASPAVTASSQFPVTINAARSDLVLSQSTVSFSLTNGAAGLPAAARVSVVSSNPAQILNYSVSSPTVPWLTISGGRTTPGALNIALNSQALQLTASAQTPVTVTCLAPSPCASNTQTILVKANVASAPPQLSIGSSALSFNASSVNPQPVSQMLALQNTGGGSITVNSVKAADSYISISGVPGSIAAGAGVLLTVTVNPTPAAGFHQSSIVVNTSAGIVTVPVTVLVSANGIMTLDPSGTLLQATAGALPGNPNGSFLVSVTGSGAVNWTASLLPGANWLTLNTTSGTSTPASPGAIRFTINSAATLLAPQAYYAAIQVASASVIDTPLTFIVVLNVTAATIAPVPMPSSAGLLFLSNGSAPRAQMVNIYASSATPLSYQAATDTSWLSVSPGTGQVSSSAPGVSMISVNPSGLTDGVYTGGVSFALGSSAVSTVNVTLILEPGVTTSARPGESPRAAGCTPAHLVPTQTGLVNTFSQPTAWPTPLSILLADDCGQPVNNGLVLASFSNGDPPLVLSATDTISGIYSGTWTPGHAAQQIAITATATAAGFPAANAVISGQVTPNNAPQLTPNGTVNAFAIAAEPGVPLAPGTIVQIYGSNLASQTAAALQIPLPTSLNQTSVIIGGQPAPLYYVSAGQINAEIPFELTAGNPYQIIVDANNALTTPATIQLTSDSPGIAQFAAGQIIAQHPDYSLVLESAPAAPGEYVTMYVAGMGLTSVTVPSGAASPAANVLDSATLTLNGAPVTNILYAGLTPTVVGLYQINFQVPANAPNGDLPLVLTQTGGVSNSTILPVHQ